MTEEERFECAKNKIIGKVRDRNGIGTLSEKSLHAILKNYYEPDESRHEISVEGSVADVFTGTEIIEIQTRNFDKMRAKLDKFLPLYPVTLVYPIPREKRIIWIDEETGEEKIVDYDGNFILFNNEAICEYCGDMDYSTMTRKSTKRKLAVLEDIAYIINDFLNTFQSVILWFIGT